MSDSSFWHLILSECFCVLEYATNNDKHQTKQDKIQGKKGDNPKTRKTLFYQGESLKETT